MKIENTKKKFRYVLLNIVVKLGIEMGDVFSIYHRQVMVPLQ